jgi:hypothetical protein
LYKTLAATGGDWKGKQNKRDRRNLQEHLKSIVARKAKQREEEHPLQLFNHLKAARDNWVVVPFRIDALEGTFKLRVPHNHQRAEQIVVEASSGSGRWSFSLSPKGGKVHLRVFCDDEDLKRQGQQKIRKLMSKLQNHGVEYDDSIYDEREFDGFSPIWEGAGGHQIDTYR